MVGLFLLETLAVQRLGQRGLILRLIYRVGGIVEQTKGHPLRDGRVNFLSALNSSHYASGLPHSNNLVGERFCCFDCCKTLDKFWVLFMGLSDRPTVNRLTGEDFG